MPNGDVILPDVGVSNLVDEAAPAGAGIDARVAKGLSPGASGEGDACVETGLA